MNAFLKDSKHQIFPRKAKQAVAKCLNLVARVGMRTPPQLGLKTLGCQRRRVPEMKKAAAFSRCGHRAKNGLVQKISIRQPRFSEVWDSFARVWSRNCCSSLGTQRVLRN